MDEAENRENSNEQENGKSKNQNLKGREQFQRATASLLLQHILVGHLSYRELIFSLPTARKKECALIVLLLSAIIPSGDHF